MRTLVRSGMTRFSDRREPGASPNATLLEEARYLYARGDLETASALLELHRDPLDAGATNLYCDSLIRLGWPERARALLRDHLPERDPKAIVRGHLLLAAAALASGNVAEAIAALDVAREHSSVAIEREEEALYRARAAHRNGDLKTFREAMKLAGGSADPVLNARAHRFAGDTLLAQSRLPEAFAEYGRGFSALASSGPRDDRLLATLLVCVSFGEAEFENAEPASTLRTIDARAWHPSVAPMVAAALAFVGRHLTRRGRYGDAATTLVRAALLARDTPAAVLALALASQNAREANEPFAAHGFSTAASELADRLPWETVNGDEGDALVTLSLMLAREGNLALAERYLGRHETLAANARRRVPFRLLFAAHASALIAAVCPATRDDGIRRLRTVRHELSRLGFVWRAIEIRADLYTVTGQAFLLEANRAKRRELTRTNGALSDDVRSQSQLSPQQMRIVASVARGNATNDIALELAISARTVKNQLHKIYQKLEIDNPSREKLVAYVHANPKLGIAADV